jgi:hypothetical protein
MVVPEIERFNAERSWSEVLFLPFPRFWSDFDDAERLGLFVPRWHHGIYAIYWAIALTLARHAFNWSVVAVVAVVLTRTL